MVAVKVSLMIIPPKPISLTWKNSVLSLVELSGKRLYWSGYLSIFKSNNSFVSGQDEETMVDTFNLKSSVPS